MARAFQKMFWGYLFIILEIHIIFIDILAEPVGYYLILSGVSALANEFPIGKKARFLSLALLVISIPTVIMQGEFNQALFGQPSLITNWGWVTYFSVLNLLNIILIFYLCKLLVEVANQHKKFDLGKSASNTLIAYVIIMLCVELYSSFSINLPQSISAGTIFIVVLASLLMHLFVLLLLHQFKRRFQEVGSEVRVDQ